jgi:hypothetical protein
MGTTGSSIFNFRSRISDNFIYETIFTYRNITADLLGYKTITFVVETTIVNLTNTDPIFTTTRITTIQTEQFLGGDKIKTTEQKSVSNSYPETWELPYILRDSPIGVWSSFYPYGWTPSFNNLNGRIVEPNSQQLIPTSIIFVDFLITLGKRRIQDKNYSEPEINKLLKLTNAQVLILVDRNSVLSCSKEKRYCLKLKENLKYLKYLLKKYKHTGNENFNKLVKRLDFMIKTTNKILEGDIKLSKIQRRYMKFKSQNYIIGLY